MDALERHTLMFYRELERLAKPNLKGELVFTGSALQVFNDLGISSAYYSRVRRVLVGSGSILVIQRGTAKQPSVIQLIQSPSDENFSDEDLTTRRHLATIVAELEKKVAALEARMESITGQGTLNVQEALRNHERRLSSLEQERVNATAEE